MNSCGFFFLDYLKDRAYRTNPHVSEEVKAEIEAATEVVKVTFCATQLKTFGSYTGSSRSLRL
jgi:hypothetical protein